MSVGRQGWLPSLIFSASSGPSLAVLYNLASIPLHHWTVPLRLYTAVSKTHLLEHSSTIYNISSITDNFCHYWNRECYYLSPIRRVHCSFFPLYCCKMLQIFPLCTICHFYLGTMADVFKLCKSRLLRICACTHTRVCVYTYLCVCMCVCVCVISQITSTFARFCLSSLGVGAVDYTLPIMNTEIIV